MKTVNLLKAWITQTVGSVKHEYVAVKRLSVSVKNVIEKIHIHVLHICLTSVDFLILIQEALQH